MAGGRMAGMGWRLLAAGVAVALALLLTVGRLERRLLTPHRPAPPTASTSTPMPGAPVARPVPLPALPAARLRLGHPAATGDWPGGLAVGEGAVWVLPPATGTLLRVDPDPRRGRVVARVRVGRAEEQSGVVLAGAGAVWVEGVPGLLRVDPRRNRADGLVAESSGVGVVAAGPDGLWWAACVSLPGGPCRLLRRDPRTLAVTAQVRLPELPEGFDGPVVDAGGGSVWVLDQAGPWVWRVALGGGAAVRVRLPVLQLPGRGSPPAGAGIALGGGAVWVLTDWIPTPTAHGVLPGPGLVRIDPATARVAQVVPLGNLDTSLALAVGAASVWVEGWRIPPAGAATAVVDRVDAATGRLTGAFDTGSTVEGVLAAGSGSASAWLLERATGELLRIDPTPGRR